MTEEELMLITNLVTLLCEKNSVQCWEESKVNLTGS